MMIKNQIFKFRESCPAPAGNPNPISGAGGKKSKVLFSDFDLLRRREFIDLRALRKIAPSPDLCESDA
jgi:hypothetical protein